MSLASQLPALQVVVPLLIFGARILDVSLGTLRVALITRDMRWPSAVVGFAESLIWLLVAVNVRGIKAAGQVQLVRTVLKILPLLAVGAVGLFHLSERHACTALRAKPVAVRTEGVIEERSDDLRDRLLNHSIQHGGYTQGPLAPGGFWNHHPQHRCRAIGALFKG